MKIFKSLIAQSCSKSRNLLVAFLLCSTILFAQNSPYQAIRLNNGDPIIEPSMFSNPNDADNINGPSLIRVPDWIPTNERAHPSAQYYLYFGHHTGDYIRMAWAANIEGPYTLYDNYTTPGNRGVLDNNESDIILGNNTYIEENHLASPDVHVDDVNQRIILYFHSGSSYFVNGVEQNDQVTWVATSPYGLEFYDGIESVHLGSSYFRVFEHGGDMYALDNGSKINKALDGSDPWAVPEGHDFTDHLWDQANDHVFQDDILPIATADLRVRHTGVHVVGNQLQAFYSRRGEFQERIQLSTVDISGDWNSWDPTYPPIEILAPNPGWEGGERTIANSETSAGIDLNQLRDPDIFEDSDGQLYLIYTGNGEGGLGIAKLYETPTYDVTLTTIADSYIKESSSNTFGHLNNLTASNGSSTSSRRTMYLRFDLSGVTDIDHAVVRLYANSTQSGSSILNSGGPVTAYETSNSWDINTLNNSNAPTLENPITTTYLTETGYYDWNISEYAKANEGSEITIAFHIAPTNSISHKFDSSRKSGGNPAQLLITNSSPGDTVDPEITCLSNINLDTDTGVDTAVVTYTAPVGTDNLPGATTVQIAGLASGASFPIGTTTNTFEVTDAAGNTAQCSFDVIISDNEDPEISCLSDINQSNDAGESEAIVTYSEPVGTDNAAGATTVQIAGLASGELFPIGTTTNTFEVTDTAGNTASCSFDVTITDDEDPVITCLSNINQSADPGVDNAVVTYSAPVGTDNATGASTVQTAGLASGDTFPLGTTTNTFEVTDTSGNTASCSFDITITDDEDPNITCLEDIIQSEEEGLNGAIVTYSAPVGTDNVAGATTVQTAGLVSGVLFPIGTTTNTFEVTDAAGNTAQCSFDVTITETDNEDPIIICLTDINQSNDIGVDGAIITYSAPVGTDNLPGATTEQITGLASGELFPIGTTTNTFVVTDVAGNTAQCSFDVTITDDENPAITCLSNMNQSTDPGVDNAVVTYSAPVGTDNAIGASTVQIAGLASGETFPLGTTTNTFEVTDAAGNTAQCSFDITISDNEDPSISCPSNIAQSNDPGQSGAIVTYVAPVGSDNVTGATTVQIAGLGSGDLFPLGTTTNTFEVTDTSGNTASCSFDVTITDDEDPTISCLSNINQSNDTGVDGAIVTYIAPVGADNLPGATTVQTAGLASGAIFPIGTTTNTFEVTDASGNTAQCSFDVTITDDEDPEISCLSDINQSNDNGLDGAIVNYVSPVGTDNSSTANTTQTAGIASGGLFPIGTTTNTFIVTDASGNSATCSFNVTITDDEDPTIVCQADINQTVGTGVGGANVTYTSPVGTDNSTGASTVQTEGLASGAFFPIGTTTNTFVVTDASGNTASCSFSVTITEETETCDILIDESNFDSSWGIWNDGGSDCRRNSNDAPFANGGTGKSVRLRDNTSTSVMTTDNLDLSSYSEITVDFNFVADLMENGEDFWLQISTDGGSSYQTVGDWDTGDEFVNGPRYFENVTIQGPFTSNTRIRFRCDATANADRIFIDDVKITGCLSSTSTSKSTSTKKEVLVAVDEPVEVTNKLFYTNPVENELIIKSDLIIDDVTIFSLNGVRIRSEKINNFSSKLNVSDLQSGTYVLALHLGNKTTTKLFVKK